MAGTSEPLDEREALYPMRVVTRLTGLPANTIRVWERRYGAVVPERTDGNARRYSSHDVRRLQLLRELTGRGHKIKDIATRPVDELEGLSRDDTAQARLAPTGADVLAPDLPDDYARLRRSYLRAIERFEVRAAHDYISLAGTMLSPHAFIFEVVVPVLEEVGERWEHNELTVAHEHMITAQLKGLLPYTMRLAQPLPGMPRVVFTTPPEHGHEFGILVGAFIAASRGFETIYLGSEMPERDLLHCIEGSGAEIVVLSVVRDMDGKELVRVTDYLLRLAATVEVWLGCPADHGLSAIRGGVRVMHTFDAMDAALVSRLS